MSKAVATRNQKAIDLERVLIKGDLSKLTEEQRMGYVQALCKLTKISLLTQPFEYISFEGRLQLYPKRAATEQLRMVHKISIKIVAREKINELYIVTAQSSDPTGRVDEAIGVVNMAGLRGKDLANAMMKAETKAKRRVTLSHCGLGALDEIESRDEMRKFSKDVAEEQVTEVEAKVEPVAEQPGFESVQIPAAQESAAVENSEPPHSGEYRLLAGKTKGKRLKDIKVKQLRDWMAWFDKSKASGAKIHPDVEMDAFHIFNYLEELPKGE